MKCPVKGEGQKLVQEVENMGKLLPADRCQECCSVRCQEEQVQMFLGKEQVISTEQTRVPGTAKLGKEEII